jgi:hypothetical protein
MVRASARDQGQLLSGRYGGIRHDLAALTVDSAARDTIMTDDPTADEIGLVAYPRHWPDTKVAEKKALLESARSAMLRAEALHSYKRREHYASSN